MGWKSAIGLVFFLAIGYVLVKNWSVVQRTLGLKKSVYSSSEDISQRLQPHLNSAGFQNLPEKVLIAAFKEEQILEVYGARDDKWVLIQKYPFTAMSGKLGPKLKEGDRQIPEGIYNIEYLNPNSSYHLSMKVNYPNEFDKQKAAETGRTKLGFDIFIHGEDRTIGCIPIGNKPIEELYRLVEHAEKQGIKVIISPRDFRTNPTYPKINSVPWSAELYDKIKEELLLIN